MITDADAKRLVNNALMLLASDVPPGESVVVHIAKTLLPKEASHAQIFRGVSAASWDNQHPAACRRHKIVFNKFKVIPKYCFDCIKISIKPRNVIELIKLLAVFQRLKLPKDNTRKCLVETRTDIPGTYGGLIYFLGIEEALNAYQSIEKILKEEISTDIPASIKRGCSEYDVAYPGFAQVNQGRSVVEYKEEWSQYERIVDKKLIEKNRSYFFEARDGTSFTTEEAKVVYTWLMYAAAIGDLSYMLFTDNQPLPPLKVLVYRKSVDATVELDLDERGITEEQKRYFKNPEKAE